MARTFRQNLAKYREGVNALPASHGQHADPSVRLLIQNTPSISSDSSASARGNQEDEEPTKMTDAAIESERTAYESKPLLVMQLNLRPLSATTRRPVAREVRRAAPKAKAKGASESSEAADTSPAERVRGESSNRAKGGDGEILPTSTEGGGREVLRDLTVKDAGAGGAAVVPVAARKAKLEGAASRSVGGSQNKGAGAKEGRARASSRGSTQGSIDSGVAKLSIDSRPKMPPTLGRQQGPSRGKVDGRRPSSGNHGFLQNALQFSESHGASEKGERTQDTPGSQDTTQVELPTPVRQQPSIVSVKKAERRAAPSSKERHRKKSFKMPGRSVQREES